MLLLYVFLLFFLLTILILYLSLQGFLAENNYSVKKNLLQVLRTTGKKFFSHLITIIVISISILNVLILCQPSNKIIRGVLI